jgi:hypothetical protein
MTKTIPNSSELPTWIADNVPEELVNSTVFKFRVKLNSIDPATKKNRIISVDILPDLNMDYETLEEQIQYLPAQYAFWAAIYSECRNMVAVAERAVKVRRAQAIRAVQNDAANNKVKFTAEQVKHLIEADKALVGADTQLQKFQMQAGKLYHMLEAIKMKAELSRSLAGFKRQEHERS